MGIISNFYLNYSVISHTNLIDLGEEINKVAWQLIFKLAPSEAAIVKILKTFNDPIAKVDWDSYFSPERPYESLYLLYIAQAILMDSSDSEIAQIRREVPPADRQLWKSKFIELGGGIEWAVKVII